MGLISAAFQTEGLNFLVTNRIPRQFATRTLGRISRIENERFVGVALRLWRVFAPELDLSEAREERFRSLRDFFVRELKPGLRPVDPASPGISSPCDAIIGASGPIKRDTLIQAKGLTYRLGDLLQDEKLAAHYEDGHFVTLRLKATMYHRFHAPTAGHIRQVNYISGDTWNVNPIALKRVERLFCRNERAVIPLRATKGEGLVTMVAVAAVGVATLRLNCLNDTLDLDYAGPNHIECDAAYEKGEQLGWFEQGSTIILLTEGNTMLDGALREGTEIRVGEALLSPLEETRKRYDRNDTSDIS